MKRNNKKTGGKKRSFRKIWSLILTAALIFTLLPSAISAETAFPFTDVGSDAWYYKDVKNAYEKGLINGKSATRYAPNDQMTYAEAVKLAACMDRATKKAPFD